jgi:uncharacterized membrane protein YfcA
MAVPFETLLLIACLSFASGTVDMCLGMGYGFTVTPVLLLLGYEPIQAVPAVLFASFMGGILSSLFNQLLGNVDFQVGGQAFRTAALIGGLGSVGAVVGAMLAVGIPEFLLTLYIGLLVSASGAFVLRSRGVSFEFTWFRIIAISVLGAFNKGLSGSGFGPIVTTGSLLSGIDEKASVSIQALSELPVSLVGFLTFIYVGTAVEWEVTTALVGGVVVAAPFAAWLVKQMDPERLRGLIGATALIVGLATLAKLFI